MKVITEKLQSVAKRTIVAADMDSDLNSFRTLKVEFTKEGMTWVGLMPGFMAVDICPVEYTPEEVASLPVTLSFTAEQLCAVVGALGSPSTTITIGSSQITVQNGRSRFVVKFFKDVVRPELPGWPDPENWSPVNYGALKKALRKVILATDRDEERSTYRGVISFNQKHITATQGTVMAVLKNEVFQPFPGETFELSTDHAARLLRVLTEIGEEKFCGFALHNKRLYLNAGSLYMAFDSACVSFPDYEDIRKKLSTPQIVFRVDKKLWKEELQRTFVSTDAKIPSVKVSLESPNTIRLSSKDEGCDTETSLDSLTSFGGETELFLSADLLKKGLSIVDNENVEVRITDDKKPIILCEDGYEFYINVLRF